MERKPPTVEKPATVECQNCRQRFPVQYIKLPFGECYDCWRRKRDARVRSGMDETAKSLMNQVLDENFIPTKGLTELGEIITEVYECFGGPRNFAMAIHAELERLMQLNKPQASTVSLMLRFMQLHWKVEERIKTLSAAELSDEQLAREQELGIIKMLLDAALDPQRRQMLDKLMGLQGMKLVDMQAAEIIKNNDHIQREIPEPSQAGN